MERKYNLPVVL